ncbi:MAG TPA: hypothetical protein PLO67_17110 [Saprospiraceae bacterium]|nr:hypothetical protein [Saprospiraceae bacterium]HPI07872.1 hypothetical protein [Saprospiraceae bacterium]
MRKILKVLRYVFGSLFAFILLVAAYVQLAPIPTYEVKAPNLNIVSDSALIAEGRRIVMTECIGCHRGEDGKISGQLWADNAPSANCGRPT